MPQFFFPIIPSFERIHVYTSYFRTKNKIIPNNAINDPTIL